MVPTDDQPVQLPSCRELREAIDTYLALAYEQAGRPATIGRLLPGESFDPAEYLMSEAVERTPPEAPLEETRAFAVRLGNEQYPNMKLRLSRPPTQPILLMSVDAHDAMLKVPPESPDYDALEALKAFNAALAGRIQKAWDEQGLPTEKRYLRDALSRAKDQADRPTE
jgi:hypothetical protein